MHKTIIFHPNTKGTGTALTIVPHLSERENEGYIILGLAAQTSTGNIEEGKPTFLESDWENLFAKKLDPIEVMEVIRVLRGERESINDGKGIVCDGAILNVQHLCEPTAHFAVTIERREGGKVEKRGIDLSLTEAGMIELALSYAMGPIVFGQ